MAKTAQQTEIRPDAAPGEYGPITYDELWELPEEVRKRRTKRVLEKYMALRGKVHIELDIDAARGRNR
jgi:hypothetical protein